MKAIISDSKVVACVASAQVLEDGVRTSDALYVGDDIQVVDVGFDVTGWGYVAGNFIVPPEQRTAIHLAIKAERDRRKFNGVFVSGKWIHTDTYSRTQWLGMVMMGAGIPAIEWTTLDGTTITTTQALASSVFNATATLDTSLFAYAKGLIDAVDAAPDPYSVDIVSGWPATFGE